MKLEFLSLLEDQRELYRMPIGAERFKAYIAKITGNGDEIAVPLVAMNPMGKAHCGELVDHLIAIDAETTVAQTLAEAQPRLAASPGDYQVGICVCDDAKGGWTNQYLTDMQYRFPQPIARTQPWLIVPIWTTRTWTPASVREAVLAALYRSAYIAQHGLPQTLDHMLIQEGWVARFAEATEPTLDPDDLAYSREILQPYRPTDQYPTQFACLYGDTAAVAVGYPPLGLSPYAGYAVARADALAATATPEDQLSAVSASH